MAVFDDVWETIQQRYYDPTFHGVDWQTSRTTFRALAAKANSPQEFYEVIRKMLLPLHDAHTRVYAPEEKFDWWNPRFITLGFTIREVEGTPTVIQVDKTSEAARNGIRSGDVLLNIDGTPAKEFIKQKLQKPGLASDASTRYRAVANALEGPAGSTVKVEWQSKVGKTKSATFTRFWNQRQLGFSSQRANDFAIIKIDAFTQSLALEFTKALPGMIDGVQGIILDLRSNGGGDAEAMADVVSPFLEDDSPLGKFVDRSGASFELHSYLRKLWPTASAGIAASSRIFEAIDARPRIVNRPGAVPLIAKGGAVSFRDVGFAYRSDTGPTLAGVTMDIPAGRKVALVGPSGAGKSTIFNLLLRFYDASSGTIAIDGQDIQNITLESLRGAIAVVTQEAVLFDESIADNIALGKPGASLGDIKRAARNAAAHDFIEAMPEGYDTRVGEGGLKLSGGQRQRIAIARAMLRDAPILLLDEATSALDAESERQVQESLARLMKGRTTIVIAHRLSTVVDADRIYVLERGQVVQSGSHAELMAADGLYANLYRHNLEEAR